jgi:hypothetical protein
LFLWRTFVGEDNMIFIITNGAMYSSNRLYFVEADLKFGEWFTQVFSPWYKATDGIHSGLKLLGYTIGVSWREDHQTATVEQLLEDLLLSSDADDLATYVSFDDWKVQQAKGKATDHRQDDEDWNVIPAWGTMSGEGR